MPIRIICLAFIFVGLFFLRFNQTRPAYKLGDKVKITATLQEHLALTSGNYDNLQQKFRLAGLYIYAPPYPEYRYGDRLEAIGEVKQSKAGYYLKVNSLQKLDSPNSLPAIINRLRISMEKLIRSYLPEPQSSLVAGMTLGSKNIPTNFYQHLKASGTLHVVVASGANIALIAGPILTVLLLFFRRQIAALATTILIWFYIALVGFDAPILRAGLMASLAFLALALGKKTWAWWSLILSGVVLLLIQPDFASDVGFQLSFLSTAGILLLSKPFQKFFKFLPAIFRENWTTSLGAQVGTFPVILLVFHQVQPLSPLVNAIILWTVPLITTLGLLAMLAGLIWYPLGQGIAYLLYPLATFFTQTVSLF